MTIAVRLVPFPDLSRCPKSILVFREIFRTGLGIVIFVGYIKPCIEPIFAALQHFQHELLSLLKVRLLCTTAIKIITEVVHLRSEVHHRLRQLLAVITISVFFFNIIHPLENFLGPCLMDMDIDRPPVASGPGPPASGFRFLRWPACVLRLARGRCADRHTTWTREISVQYRAGGVGYVAQITTDLQQRVGWCLIS